ncbi:GNAT family N-acetyltransferase [Sinorhizobium sp. BG8]|uniref:GNAT family N-acetyltransferase n=1 Tax=Sinorhizobium sp. BG8 TaxID=2613773 RepID=UPI00193EA28F|nr:GNAT family N-acetyltransferase [Sinorhizobium sp. BG8]QRM55813.1 GNAT family N-acetyltransferase [Sinorhizobium sp. BG8]
MLSDGYTDIPDGKLAVVATCLQMFRPPAPGRDPDQPDLSLGKVEAPDLDWYRDLYRRIGAEWLWGSRLAMSDGELHEVIGDPAVDIWAVTKDGRAEGLLELDFRQEGECELAFFGLSSAIIGQGAGRWLMNRAIERAWSKPISRFWVHTCTLDHPSALNFYVRSGFVPFKRQIEVFDDPRLVGTLAEDVAPRVPILRPAAR